MSAAIQHADQGQHSIQQARQLTTLPGCCCKHPAWCICGVLICRGRSCRAKNKTCDGLCFTRLRLERSATKPTFAVWHVVTSTSCSKRFEMVDSSNVDKWITCIQRQHCKHCQDDERVFGQLVSHCDQ